MLIFASPITITAQEISNQEEAQCSCVEYVRKLSKYQPPKVYAAWNIPAIRLEPKENGWLLWKPGKLYSQHGHVSYIEKIWQSPTPEIKIMEIKEFNFKPCKVTKRFVSTKDELIRGYFYHDLY